MHLGFQLKGSTSPVLAHMSKTELFFTYFTKRNDNRTSKKMLNVITYIIEVVRDTIHCHKPSLSIYSLSVHYKQGPKDIFMGSSVG